MVYLKCLYIYLFSFLWYHFFAKNWKQLIDKRLLNKIYNYYNAKTFKRNYLKVNSYSEQYLLNIYKEKEKEFFNKFCDIKIWETVYLYALYWAAWDYACAYIFIKNAIQYLQSKNCKIILIWNEKLKDIIWLYKFSNIKSKYTKFYMYWVNEDCAKLLIKNDIIIKNNKLICINFPTYWDLFLKDPEKYWWIKYYYNLSETFRNRFWIKDEIQSWLKYIYDNLNNAKLDNILKNYNNKWWLIICNFENKSFRAYKNDEIQFNYYINSLNGISNELHVKFVVNSVYNNEKLYNNDNILITRLNRQEIIWLAENNKIGLFISERNWLNDVFYVFYPKMNQIIYYPDCYYTGVCINKYLYNDIYMSNLRTDTLNAHYLFGRKNIIQNYRKDYFRTITTNIEKLFFSE